METNHYRWLLNKTLQDLLITEYVLYQAKKYSIIGKSLEFTSNICCFFDPPQYG